MSDKVSESYLVNEVLTATPEKLQLILVEAAIRAAERAKHYWQTDEDEKACESLVRAQDITGELLAGLNHEVDPPLARRVASIYAFVLQRLVEASLQRNPKALDDALRVLKIERDTWQQLCQKMAAQRQAAQSPAGRRQPHRQSAADRPSTADGQSPPPPLYSSAIPPVDSPIDAPSEGLSLEA